MMGHAKIAAKGKPRSEVEVYVSGEDLIIYEYYSKGEMERILGKIGKDYGLILHKKCRSPCG